MTEFEETGREITEDGGIDEIPTRSQGEYAATNNPWPRDEGKEARAVAEMHKRKPCSTRRQGNRWDQYGESSSAASSEAHGMSDSMYTESTWGPCESVSKSQRAAQPYRLQKANKSDGQWSRWASDVRQSHRINGVIALQSGCRLPATIVHGRGHLNGKDRSGLSRLSGP